MALSLFRSVDFGKGLARDAHAVDAGRHAGSYDIVSALIRGGDPALAGQEIAFSCHLDHPHPGANDNASGCATILEVARTFTKLIREGTLPRPARSLRFLWPPEVEGTTILLDRGWGPERVLDEALVEGMRIVGIDFRDGILFVPEVLLAANAMKAGMAILRPLLAETGAEPVGKVVIGTVKGDIHDIGKNLVGMMLEGAGFEVVDLGINTDADKFINALNEHKPDILGMSALLTTTMPYMKVVIDELVAKGIRDDYIVLVGGAPLNEEFGKAVGADAYCRDAAVAAETAQALVLARRAAAAAS